MLRDKKILTREEFNSLAKEIGIFTKENITVSETPCVKITTTDGVVSHHIILEDVIENPLLPVVEELVEMDEEANKEPVIEITGSFAYLVADAAGGDAALQENSLALTKNGEEVEVTFTYSCESDFAIVDESTGVVTFEENETYDARTVVVTASCTYEDKTYTATAEATQNGHAQ